MGAAVEDIDAVLAVDRDRGDVAEAPAHRQLGPVLHHAVTMLARAENGWHVWILLSSFSPCGRRWRGRSPCRMRGPSTRRETPHPSSLREDTLSHKGRGEESAIRGISPSSIALTCSARNFELIRHCARLPAMNQRPGWVVRVYMLRNSWPSPNPQIGPMRSTTASPNSWRTRCSCGL